MEKLQYFTYSFSACICFLLVSSSLIHGQNLERKHLVVNGSEDYRSTLFKTERNVDDAPPFSIHWVWEMHHSDEKRTDTLALYRHIRIGLDTVNSFIREDFSEEAEKIGKVILDILELHRREMMLAFVDESARWQISLKDVDVLEDILIGTLQLSIGMLPSTLMNRVVEEMEAYFTIFSSLRINCDLMLAQFRDELTSPSGMPIKERKDLVVEMKDNKPYGVFRRLSNNPLGLTVALGIQASALNGNLQSGMSFQSIRPIILLDMNYRNFHLFTVASGVSFQAQPNTQLGGILLNDNSRNFFTSYGFSLGYGFMLNNSLRIIPELSFRWGTFHEDIPKSDETISYTMNMWGWGFRVQNPMLKFRGRVDLPLIYNNQIGLEYFFRHQVYASSATNRGNIFTLGLLFYFRSDAHNSTRVNY
ncbi:MAG: hypothetical protein JJU02_01495 [Cryomorphaceae bacterium]|nr:hypothetical protein [Cryomorphaceae bacterium]